MKTKEWIRMLLVWVIGTIVMLCAWRFFFNYIEKFVRYETPQGCISDEQIKLEIEELRKTVNTMK